MKRVILFRGKEIKTGKWIEGDLLRMGGHSFISPDPAPKGFNQYEVDPETIGQFTGVKDKNGTRIFEGDIVEDRYGNRNIVIYNDDTMSWVCHSEIPFVCNIPMSVIGDCDIFGNIHDNPELL